MEILLVESNLGDICLIKEALKETANNCNLTVTSDGSEAISYICDNRQKIDLLILSTYILKVNALEILEAVKRKSCLGDIPTIIFGDMFYDEDRKKAYSLGVTKHYSKPIEYIEYSVIVKSFIKIGFNGIK